MIRIIIHKRILAIIKMTNFPLINLMHSIQNPIKIDPENHLLAKIGHNKGMGRCIMTT
jgi:hypothetical protein